MSTTSWLPISDLQVPYHDPKAVNAVLEFIHEHRDNLKGLLCVGDEFDCPQPSRWTRGLKGEFADTILKDLNKTHVVMAAFREAIGPDKPFHVVRSNHGDRILKYVQSSAPALAPFVKPGGILDIPTLLRYDELGITYHRQPYEFEKGWLLAHGDEGGLRQIAGTTAAGLAQRWQKNVVCGHSHRAGLVPTSYGVLGNQKTLWGLEVGNLMDLKKASYLLPAQAANWQQAFGLIHVTKTGRKTVVTPEIRWIVNGAVSRGLEAA